LKAVIVAIVKVGRRAAISSLTVATSKRLNRTRGIAATRLSITCSTSPVTWKIGASPRIESPSPASISERNEDEVARRLRWVSSAPFDGPVVPDV
jgi:hypothetical protein